MQFIAVVPPVKKDVVGEQPSKSEPTKPPAPSMGDATRRALTDFMETAKKLGWDRKGEETLQGLRASMLSSTR